MAHKKAGGSSRNGRDSAGRRLGVKRHDGQSVNESEILVRQRGTVFNAGENVYVSKDHTLHAKIAGIVKFVRKAGNKKFVNVQAVTN